MRVRLEEGFGRFIDSLRAAKHLGVSPNGNAARIVSVPVRLLAEKVDALVTNLAERSQSGIERSGDVDLAGLRHAFAIRAELSSPATMAHTHPAWSRLYRFLRTEGLVTVNPLEGRLDSLTSG